MSDWAIWGALIVVAAACAAASALLVARTRTAWSDVLDLRRDVIGGLDDLQANSEAVAEKLAALEEQGEELEQSLGRLRVSLARLTVLRAAIDDAQITFGRIVAVVPRR